MGGWEIGDSWCVEEQEQRRFVTEAKYQPKVIVSGMLNKLIRQEMIEQRFGGFEDLVSENEEVTLVENDNDKEVTLVELDDDEDFELEALEPDWAQLGLEPKKPHHVRVLNFETNILSKPYVPVSALGIRREKEELLLKEYEIGNNDILVVSKSLEPRKRKLKKTI